MRRRHQKFDLEHHKSRFLMVKRSKMSDFGQCFWPQKKNRAGLRRFTASNILKSGGPAALHYVKCIKIGWGCGASLHQMYDVKMLVSPLGEVRLPTFRQFSIGSPLGSPRAPIELRWSHPWRIYLHIEFTENSMWNEKILCEFYVKKNLDNISSISRIFY